MPFPTTPASLLTALTALSPSNQVLAAYIPSVSSSVTVSGGKVTAIADCSGNGAASLLIQEATGTSIVDATSGILATNNHWYATSGGFTLDTGLAKSVLSCAQIRDNAGTVFDWWPSSWVAPWDVPMGITNDSGVNAASRATNTQQPILHDNAPTLMGPSEWGVYAFYSGRNVTTQFRAQGFNFTGSVVSNGVGGWVGNSLHIGWLGNGNRDNYHLAHIVLNGQFTYEQAIMFERWCKTRTTYPDAQTPKMLGTNPQWQTLTTWPAGPLKFFAAWGDSITAGVGTGGNQQHFIYLISQSLGNGWAFYDAGINGQTLAGAAITNLPKLAMNPLNTSQICVIWLGTNSLYLLDVPAELAALKALALYAWGLGYKPILVNCLKRTDGSSFVGFEAQRTLWNAGLESIWASCAYALCDVGSLAQFQTVNDAGTEWMADGVHPNDAGHAVLAPVIQASIEAVDALPILPVPELGSSLGRTSLSLGFRIAA